MRAFRLLLRSAALTALLLSSAANASLLKSYDFEGDLADSLGVGDLLTASGGTVAGGRYTFAANQGLRLTNALADTSNYAIEMKFQINDSLSGWNKLIDFQDLQSDLGHYFLGDQLRFFTLSGNLAPISANQDIVVGLARSADVVQFFLDGNLVGSLSDTGGQAVSAPNVLNFFEDDVRTGQTEAFAGSVDWIRIHESAASFGAEPVPAPAPLLVLGVALAAAGFFTRRRR